MKEKDFISQIVKILNSHYIGDDCAYLKDLDIVITQDSLVEDIHFKTSYMTPFQLGFKSVMVNLSDIASSGAIAKYLTISLSLPSNTDEKFIKEFYLGAKKACGNSIQIVGGDITGSDKIFVSVCAIGSTKNRKISSRKNAKIGYKIVLSGNSGSSARGLKLLLNNIRGYENLKKAHLEPIAQLKFGASIGENITSEYAMMDTSDGLMDALSTIAKESNVLLEVDFEKIPHDKTLEKFENWENDVLFGGEDYGIVAVLPDNFPTNGIEIGKVKQGSGIDLKIDGLINHYERQDVEDKIFKHF